MLVHLAFGYEKILPRIIHANCRFETNVEVCKYVNNKHSLERNCRYEIHVSWDFVAYYEAKYDILIFYNLITNRYLGI